MLVMDTELVVGSRFQWEDKDDIYNIITVRYFRLDPAIRREEKAVVRRALNIDTGRYPYVYDMVYAVCKTVPFRDGPTITKIDASI